MPLAETFPYNIHEVTVTGGKKHVLSRWGMKDVILTDDSAYDPGTSGCIILIYEGDSYFVPGCIKRCIFHDDTSYAQLLPLDLLQETRPYNELWERWYRGIGSFLDLPLILSSGSWQEIQQSDYTRYFAHTDIEGVITIVEIMNLRDHDSDMDNDDRPFTGSYRQYGRYEDISLSARELSQYGGCSLTEYTSLPRAEQCVQFFDIRDNEGQDSPLSHWRQGYRSFSDVLSACGIPESARRYDGYFERNK